METELTVVVNRDGLARSKDGERLGVGALSSLLKRVLDLVADEAGRGTGVGGDGEGVGREGVESTAGVVEELEGLVTSVGEGGGDLQVVDTVDCLGTGDLERETGRSRDNGRGSSEGNEGSANSGGEHGDGVVKLNKDGAVGTRKPG